MSIARKWRRKKERENRGKPLEELARETELVFDALEDGDFVLASTRAEAVQARGDALGARPAPVARTAFQTAHGLAFEAAGPSSVEGGLAVHRWLASGGDAIPPAVARLAEAWRRGDLEGEIPLEGLPDLARDLFRFTAELLSRTEDALPDARRLKAEVRRRFGSVAPHLADLFADWLAAIMGRRASVPASLRKDPGRFPVASALSFYTAAKPRLLGSLELPAKDGRSLRPRFLIATAMERLEGAASEDSLDEVEGHPLGAQYPPGFTCPDGLYGLDAADLDEFADRLGDAFDMVEDHELRTVQACAVEALGRAIRAGRVDLVHGIAGALRVEGELEGRLEEDVVRLELASGFLTGCPSCTSRARVALLERLGPGPERRALCREILRAPRDETSAEVRAAALAAAAEEGEALDPDEEMRRGAAVDRRLVERLGSRERQRLELERALEGTDRGPVLAALGELARDAAATGDASGLAADLAGVFERELEARAEQAVLAGLGAGKPPGGLPFQLALREAEVMSLSASLEKGSGALDLGAAIGLLSLARRVFGTGSVLGHFRAALLARIESLLDAGGGAEGGDPFFHALCLVSAGLLCGREEPIAEGARRLRRFVQGAATPRERARGAWDALLALEPFRKAYPEAVERVDLWQRYFLAAIQDLDREDLWSPFLDGDIELAVDAGTDWEDLSTFLRRNESLLPGGAEAPLLLAMCALKISSDLESARRWIALARRRGGARSPRIMEAMRVLEAFEELRGMASRLQGASP